MPSRIATVAAVFGALTSGATVVVYVNFSARVMPSLGRMANASGIARMQHFNRTAEQGPFMLCFFGAALAGGYLVYQMVRGDRSAADLLLAAGGTSYLAGLLLTIAYNVPLNGKLARLDPHARSSVAFWRDYLGGWTTAKSVRAGLSAVATALLIGGLVAGLRAWGNDPAGGDAMLVASYPNEAQLGTVLAAALPELSLVRGADSPLLPLLVAEAGRDALGQDAVLDRILDVVLISVVREWAAQTPSGVAGLQLLADPAVAGAVRLNRAHPAQAWTVEELASRAGVSRAALARRFQDVIGIPPISYLAQWRLSLAADLLRGTDRTLAAAYRSQRSA